MKTLLTSGQAVRIQFRHTLLDTPKVHEREPHARNKPVKWSWIKAETVCRLVTGYSEGEVDVIPEGRARCAVVDQYRRDTAREVALHHMLGIDKRWPLSDPRQQKLVLSSEDTGRVLAAYYGRKRGSQPRTQQTQQESRTHG